MVCRATFILLLQLDFPLLKLAYRTLPISLCEGLVRDVQRDTWELETPGTCLLAYAMNIQALRMHIIWRMTCAAHGD